MRDFGRQMHDYAKRQAAAARDRARATAARRKEEYLGARVPKELRDKVIARARDLGIPVSILIRNLLEEAFGRAEEGAAGAERAVRYPGVLGWEDIVLNRAMPCTACGRAMATGARVTLGLGAPGEDHVILCDQCSESL
jgi:hypothetical protein